MSPSAWQRGLGHSIFYTLNYLAHLEGKACAVFNATGASIMKFRKRCKLTNLEKTGIALSESTRH